MRKQRLNQSRYRWQKLVRCFSMVALAVMFAGIVKAQDPPQYGTPFTGVPDIRDVNMYQVHNRPYSAAGNFAGITARLDSIKALGVNVVYVMPIYPHGTDSRSSASPYSIKGFDSVATEYGTLTDFRNLVAGCHTRGMAVILDFAVNGTSWDHPWITQHPNWYVQSGGTIQQLANFPDVAALDFTNTDMRAAMVQSMRYWIFAANIDGFRCDFANNPPIDFWTNTIANLRGITTHKLIMLAEGDRQANYQAGFDYDFGDDFYYDAIQPISTGASVSTIQTTTNTEYTDATGSQQMARYTSNHDIETSTTAISQFGGHNGVIANYLVCAYMRAVPFLTSGQEVDFNQTIPWPYTTVKINWSANLTASADFKKINNYRTTSEAIRRGVMANFSDNNTCAFTKTSQTTNEKVVVMVNLRNSTQNYVIPAAIAGNYKNAYTGAAVTLTSGATQSLTAFQYIVLTNQNVATVPVTGVTLSPTTASIATGLTQQLTATVAPSNASNQNVTWSSSNTAVATVSTAGLVTAIAAGTATITVTTQDGGKTATCAVTVTAASHFTVNFYRPSTWGTGIDIYWWSAQPASVLADGTWPGVAMTNNGNNWYSYTFTNVTSTNVIFDDGSNQTANLSRSTTGWYYNGNWYNTQPVPVTGVTVSPTSATLNVNGTQQITATLVPSNATVTGVTWSSSNTAIATVSSSGLVTAVAGGAATITATTNDNAKTANCAVTVNTTNVPVTGVTVSPTTASISVGGTQQLTATVAPSNATNKTVSWSSSNTAVATVSAVGLVTAVAAGTATITVTTQDGAKTANCTVTVTAASGFTVYFYRPASWGTGIKIYWWNAQPAGNLADGTWPGVNMTNTSGNWYSYTFTNITSTNLIFNDGSNQTANLSRSSNGWYYNGNWYNSQPVPVTGVAVSPTSATVAVGATRQLSATLAPSNATMTGVTWSSDNTSVATVNASGLVTAVAAGTAAITVTTNDNGYTANSTITVTASGSATYYNILNRWQPNTYLYDAGNGKVQYGTSPSGNNNYLCEQVAGPSGYVYLVNRGTGNMMHVEDQNGAIESTTGNPAWYSAMWSIVSTGDGWNYIENRWQTSDWVNIQNLAGYAQYSGVSSGFYSAEWQFVNSTVFNNDAFNPGIISQTNPVEVNGLSGGVNGEPMVHQALSPNGDGINDVLLIENISRYPENRLLVTDARGLKVFESANYDNISNTFAGRSSVSGKLVPAGTYFYMLEYKEGSTLKYKRGFIMLKY